MLRLSLVAASGGSSPNAVYRLLVAVASLVAEHGSRHSGFHSCSAWAQQLWLRALEHWLSSCTAWV